MQRAVFAVLVALSLSCPVWAEPIQIVSGSLQVTAGLPGSLTMTGDSRGFTWNSGVSTFTGVFLPDGAFAAGTTVPLSAGWVGSSILGGSATIDGIEHEGIGGMSVRSPQARLRFDGTAGVLPSEGIEATFMAPFGFEGIFAHYANPSAPLANLGDLLYEDLFGQGIATLVYAMGADSLWSFQSATYAFDVPTGLTPTPNPEPASLLLVGTGALYVMRRTFRRTRA